jgi:hypothetical protein
VFWIALALTQAKLGRLVPEVQQRALRAIDDPRGLARWTEPKLRRQREVALTKARTDLLAPPKPPSRVARRERSSTPLSPGDVIAYTHDSGRVVALWVTANKSDKGGTYSRVLVAAVGQPDLAPLGEIVAAEPPTFGSPGRERPLSLLLLRCQQLPEGRWEVLGNVPWPEGRRVGMGAIAVFVNPPPRAKRMLTASLDRRLDVCF